MPELKGVMPHRVGDVPFEPCIWCEHPTDMRFIPEAMPELGPRPMHLACAIDLLLTYQAWLAKRALPDKSKGRIERLQRLALH